MTVLDDQSNFQSFLDILDWVIGELKALEITEEKE